MFDSPANGLNEKPRRSKAMVFGLRLLALALAALILSLALMASTSRLLAEVAVVAAALVLLLLARVAAPGRPCSCFRRGRHRSWR